MKYTKPNLRSIDFDSELYCGNGSGASSSGCTTGVGVNLVCHVGSGNVSCWDGTSPSVMCAIGSGPSQNRTRCFTGNSPT